MRRFRVFLLVAAGLMAGVLLIGLLGSAVPVAANPDIDIQVNYGHDWVSAHTGPSTVVTITLSDNGGVKGTYNGQTDINGDLWTHDGTWTPDDSVQINPGDIVSATAGIDSTAVNPIGVISGDLDIDADIITGTIEASWFSTVDVSCNVWVNNGPNSIDIPNVSGNGGSYTCDFSGAWDIMPGQTVAVSYSEPDGDQVINTFSEPVPDLEVEKRAEGSGQSAPGLPLIFHMRLENRGEVTAQSIVLTDTMPANTTYISDSSGISPTVSSGEIVWNMDPLDAGKEKEFFLVLGNSASAGDKLLNKLQGTTPFDSDDGNNYDEAEVEIVDGQPDLYVDKWAEPWDPAPGQTFEYRIDYGNNGPVSSETVTLTDILPPEVTIVGWTSREGYNLWQENSSGGNFILEAESIPGNWGDTINLRVRLDANVDPGTELYNKVMIATANDSDPENNQREDWRDVGEPRWNGRVDKGLGWGILAPDGQVAYNLYANNDGNMATNLTITDTIPLGTSFDKAWSEVNGEWVSFPPDDIDGRELSWDLGSFEPGEGQGIHLRLKLDDVKSGDTIINCAVVTISGDDKRPYDNKSCVTEMIYETGANLRVTKTHWWDNDDRIRFTIHVENIGTTTLRDVEIVDTYPADTSFSGDWWHHHWQDLKFTHNDTERKLIWMVDEIHSGNNFEINFILNVDGSVVGEQGLAFTNLVEAPVDGDVYPANNSDEDTAYSGPNLFVKKWLATELPNPGDIVTFVVEFGNATQGYWGTSGNVSLIDAVGEGMTFISATEPDNPDKNWLPKLRPDGKLWWEWGNAHSDSRWRFEMTVKIDGDVERGTLLTNKIEVFSVSQDDIDPVPENNADDATFRAGQVVYLPVAIRQ